MVESQLTSVLGYQLAQARVVTDAVFDIAVRKPYDLRVLDFTILALICENPGVSPMRLARALAVTAPLITGHVDRLVERGLIERIRSSKDGRRQYLHPTEDGLRLKSESTDRVIAQERRDVATLTPGEYAMLLELLHKLAGTRTSARMQLDAETG